MVCSKMYSIKSGICNIPSMKIVSSMMPYAFFKSYVQAFKCKISVYTSVKQ